MMSGAAVNWKSCKQMCVALSTAEAENIALAGAVQEATWMRQLLEDLHNGQFEPTVILDDNQSTICIAQILNITARPNTSILRIIMFEIKFWTALPS